jgi:hypothetical protein
MGTEDQLVNYGEPGLPIDPVEDEPKRRQTFTALEIAEQVRTVQDWLAEGARPNVIRRRCADRWGIATRTSEARMQAARRQAIADINCQDRGQAAAVMIERLESLIEQCMANGQGSNALGAMRLMSDLLQLIDKKGAGMNPKS